MYSYNKNNGAMNNDSEELIACRLPTSHKML